MVGQVGAHGLSVLNHVGPGHRSDQEHVREVPVLETQQKKENVTHRLVLVSQSQRCGN